MKKMKLKRMDLGGDPPIKVRNPNDPRLQRYKDSMSLYDWGEDMAAKLKKLPESGLAKWQDLVGATMPGQAIDRLKAYNKHYPEEREMVERHYGYNHAAAQERFTKPVQPYYYEPPGPSKVGNVVPTTSRGAITPSTTTLPQATVQPTPFSFSGMGEDRQQKTMYFPDLNSWKDFSDKQGYLHRETTNNEQEAHATGHFKYGGVMKKMKLKKMFVGGPNDPDTDPGPAVAGAPVDAGLTGGNQFAWANDTTIPGLSTGFAAPRRGVNWDAILGTAAKGANALAPYASNIANAFRNPPMPHQPDLVNPVVLSKINLSNAKNSILRQTHTADMQANKYLDPQSAAAVRVANLSKGIEGTSQVAEQEAFLNSRQTAEQAGMNLNVNAMNVGATNRYRDSLTERNVALQREQSQNLSNAADKYIGINNEKAKADLDLKKIGVLSQMWQNSGVYDRMLKKLKDRGIDDPTGILNQRDSFQDGGVLQHNYDAFEPMAFGGFNPALKTFPMNKGRATGQAQINPFGNSKSIRVGSSPAGKFNPKHVQHIGSRIYRNGGSIK